MIPNPAYNNQVLVDIWLEIQPIKIELSFVQMPSESEGS